MLADAAARRRPSRDGSGHHRRATRHAPREEKELLQDAAVVGRVFWLGALGRERWTLEERLHSLERKEFVRPRTAKHGGRRGRVRLPPRPRARRGVRADPASGASGASIGRPPSGSSRSAGPRTTRRWSPTTTCRPSTTLAHPARTSSRSRSEAGSPCGTPATARSPSTRSRPAARYYELAVELWPGDDPTARAAPALGAHSPCRGTTGGGALEQARDVCRRRAGSTVAQAEALLAEAVVVPRRPRGVRSPPRARVRGSSSDLPSSPGKGTRAQPGSRATGCSRAPTRRRFGSVKQRSAWPTSSGSSSLSWRRSSASVRQDPAWATPRGLDDLERAVAIADAAGSSSSRPRVQQPGRCRSGHWGTSRRGRRLMDEAVAHAERLRHWRACAGSRRNVRNWLLAREGHWDEAFRQIEEFIAACEAGERALPRGRHAPSAGGHPAGARRRPGLARRRPQDRAARTERGRSAAALSRGSRGASASSLELGRTRRSTRARGRSARRDASFEPVGSRRSRARRGGARMRRRARDACSSAATPTKWTVAASMLVLGDVV